MHIDILGTLYNVKFQTNDECSKLNTQDADGLAELYSKELIIRTGYENNKNCYNNITAYREKVLRHEIIHAIFHESGLQQYCDDELLVNFLAIQYPKIKEIMDVAKEMHEEIMKGSEKCYGRDITGTIHYTADDWDIK